MSWRESASCIGHDPDLWFAGLDTDTPSHTAADRENTRRAIAICAGCPVQTECLEDAIGMGAAGDVAGIRGGVTVDARRRVRKSRKRTRQCSECGTGFLPREARQITCANPACRAANNRRKQRERRAS